MNLNNYQENFFQKLQRKVLPFIYRKDLRKLATFYGTNKWNEHYSAQNYNRHFAPLSLVIVYKGNNNEGSSFLENNTLTSSILKTLGVESLEELGIEFSPSDKFLN